MSPRKTGHAALYLSLTMPDICSKLENPASAGSGQRYTDWYDRFLLPINTANIQGHDVVFMTSGDCWALRCAVLHEGSDDVRKQRAKDVISKFRFTSLPMHRIKANDALVLNVAEFCEEVCLAVEAWTGVVAKDADVQDRISSLLRVEDGDFSPHPNVKVSILPSNASMERTHESEIRQAQAAAAVARRSTGRWHEERHRMDTEHRVRVKQAVVDLVERLSRELRKPKAAIADIAYLQLQKHPAWGRNPSKAQKRAAHKHWRGECHACRVVFHLKSRCFSHVHRRSTNETR